MSTVRVAQLGVDCVAASGGTQTLMHAFRRALDAPIVSVTAPSLVPADSSGGVLHVPSADDPLRRGYRIPRTGEPHRRAIELLSSAELLVIHGLFRYTTGWGYRLARRLGIPFWLVPHGSLDPWVFSYRSFQKRLWMRTTGGAVLGAAARVVLASPRELAKAAEVTAPAVRRTTVLWPVEEPPPTESRPVLRARLGVPSDGRLLVTMGRLHPNKGILPLLRAFGRVSAQSLRLLVIGPGSEALSREECERVAEREAPGRIHFAGLVHGAERFALLAAADGYITLSHRESFGLAVAEAMRCGLPIIASRETGVVSALGDVRCGWILGGHEESDAVPALEQFADADATLLRALGEAGRAWATQELSFDRFATRLRELAEASVRDAFHR